MKFELEDNVPYSSQNSDRGVVSRRSNRIVEQGCVPASGSACRSLLRFVRRAGSNRQYHEQKAFDIPPPIEYYGLGKLPTAA